MALEMTDLELIEYCAAHCKTERALFSPGHIRRMAALAGVNYAPTNRWLHLREPMEKMCELARERSNNQRPKSKPCLTLVVNNIKGV